MDYPTYVTIDNKRYDINTDFRVAIKCNEIATDETIGAFERAMALIYTLYGEEAMKDLFNYDKLLDFARKYLSCNKEVKETNEKPDMDYIEDYDYIEASFMSDFHIDLSKEKMHWWKFNKLINGLSNSEMGNCCILNRVRSIRNIKLNDIKDLKERDKIKKLQEELSLSKYKKENHLTKEQEESILNLEKIINRGK